MTKILSFILLCLLLALPLSSIGLAQPNPAQEMSGEERMRQMQEQDERLRKKIEKKKEAPSIEEELPKEAGLPESTEKISIKKINVSGATLISEKKISNIITSFENKELTLRDMQKVADLVTDLYRQKGYVTSRAYLPPQKIDKNILEIRILEGRVGDVDVKGNRFFRTSLLKRMIRLIKGLPFDYNVLRRNLGKINQHPDRNVRAVLMPSKEAGATDVILEVKDRPPVHFGATWDNFGSRYIDKNRYQGVISFNNFLGFDDILSIQYQTAEANKYRLGALRYILPITDSTEIGFFGARTQLKLGKEFEDINARGKSQLYSIYVRQSVIDTDNVDLNVSIGFDYKDIFNFQLGNESSRDRLRVAKASFDLDILDNFGRTIFTNEIDYGIPDMWGGLKRKDPRSSREGAGGKFVKDTINLLRLQKMPFSSTLLWKNQIQISPYTLTAAEQFQIGGIANVRGYPPAEFVGDRGYSMTWEWSFPPYFIPKNIKIPYSQVKIYDAFRIVGFYDWGNVRLHRPQPGEEKYKTLTGAGCGFRFNMPEDFSVRVDFAWPLNRTPSDENHFHPWFEISKSF